MFRREWLEKDIVLLVKLRFNVHIDGQTKFRLATAQEKQSKGKAGQHVMREYQTFELKKLNARYCVAQVLFMQSASNGVTKYQQQLRLRAGTLLRHTHKHQTG